MTVGEARWPWWHPLLWVGVGLHIVATVLVVLRVVQWADAQPSAVSPLWNSWGGLAAVPIALVAAAVAALWVPGRPHAAPHVLWRAACNCFVFGGVGLVTMLVVTFYTDGGSGDVGRMLLTAFVTSGIGFGLLGIVLLLVASTVDVQRRKGHVLRPWDVATLPGTIVGLFAFAIFGSLAAYDFDEEGPSRLAGVVRILFVMVGLVEPARPGWLGPAWIGLVVFVVCLWRSIRLSKRHPDL